MGSYLIKKDIFIEIREGLAKILVPNPELFRRPDGVYEPAWAPVFYNPQMVFNRDIAILFLRVIKKYTKLRRVYEPLAGTGVRGIRFVIEVGEIDRVIMNDIDRRAYEVMKLNVELNKLSDVIELRNEDANKLMFDEISKGYKACYIDIDPFGSPAPYVQSSLILTRRNGFVSYTATDMAPLTGKYPSKALRRYQVRLVKTDFEKEIALRSLISYIIRKGAEHDIAAEPVLAYYADHYIRTYFMIKKGAMEADNLLQNLGYIIYCPKCLYREPIRNYPIIKDIPQCPRCNSNIEIIGPLWLGKLVDKELLNNMKNELSKINWLQTINRITKLLDMLAMESEIRNPFYYKVDELCSKLRTHMPKILNIIECLESKGYRTTRTHFDNVGIKTEAPINEVESCIRT